MADRALECPSSAGRRRDLSKPRRARYRGVLGMRQLCATAALIAVVIAPAIGTAAAASPMLLDASAAPANRQLAATGTANTVPLDENEFIPDNQPIGNCRGMLERPNCGSTARGGPAQTALFLALIAGLTFIGWRIYTASRKSSQRQEPSA